MIKLFVFVVVVLREITLTISDSIETGLQVETEIERVVSLSTTEITEITRLKKKKKTRSSGSFTLMNSYCRADSLGIMHNTDALTHSHTVTPFDGSGKEAF